MKNIIITGASKGIGKALAAKLANKDSNLILCARSLDKLNETKSLLESRCNSVTCAKLDLSNEKDMLSFTNKLKKEGTKIDILVNNAGIGYNAWVKDTDLKKAKDLFQVNFFSIVLLCREMLNGIMPNGGRIVNIASEVSFRGLPAKSIYSATKAAVKSFSESLQADARKQGIKVIMIYPGYTETDFHQAANEFSDMKNKPRKAAMPMNELASYIAKKIRQGKFENIPSKEGYILKFANAVYPELLAKIFYKKYRKQMP